MPEQNQNTIVISALGMLSPIGGNAEQTCAAIRASISSFNEHPFYECICDNQQEEEGTICFTSRVPHLEPETYAEERLLQLATPALQELISKSCFSLQKSAKSGLLLALPQPDKVTKYWQLDSYFATQLCQRAGLGKFKLTDVNQEGRSAMFSLVNDAISYLQSEKLDYCIVGGVDSWLDSTRLENLDNDWRVKSQRNVDGFIPGEAAVMLMLETQNHARSRGISALSTISAIGFGYETQSFHTECDSSGEGMAKAIETVMQSKPANHFYESVYCDLNGESYSAYEWGLMQARLGKVFEKVKKLIHPAENCGDVGVASGGLLLACASMALKKGYNQGNDALLLATSDTGTRAALTLQMALLN